MTTEDQTTLPYELWEAFDPARIVQCGGCSRQLVAPIGHEPMDTYCCVDCYRGDNAAEIEDGLESGLEDRHGDT